MNGATASPGQIKKFLKQLSSSRDQYFSYLGQLAYQEYMDGDLPNAKLQDACKSLDDIHKQIAQWEEELKKAEMLKKMKGGMICPGCGGVVGPGLAFCPTCGRQVLAVTQSPTGYPSTPGAPPTQAAPGAQPPPQAAAFPQAPPTAVTFPPTAPATPTEMPSTTCPSCGAEIDEETIYCASCGSRVKVEEEAGVETPEQTTPSSKRITCSSCGAIYEEEDVTFCSECGQKLRE